MNRLLIARSTACWCTLLFAAVLQPYTHAATYHLKPGDGSSDNPGTPQLPWGSLQSVAAAGKRLANGDILLLYSGHHGSPQLGSTHQGMVSIQPAPDNRPTLCSIGFHHTKGWQLRDLEISPSTAPEFKRETMVFIAGDASMITVEGCQVYTAKDSSAWSVEDWNSKACNGFDVRGPSNTIRGNHLLNVNFGISITGTSNRVERNTVENFSGDGLRGLGDYGVFEYNTVKNCYAVNQNHDDGFQSWSVGPSGVGSGTVRGIILRGNRILNYEDPNQPHRGTLQGIGCFDGFYEDWVIENNEILTDHWHGITLGGAINCRIINNTVLDLNTSRPGPPWIMIGSHKNGSPSRNNVVRNNLTTDLQIEDPTAEKDHNLILEDPERHFTSYAGRNLQLKAGSPAIDGGSNLQAPALDAGESIRPVDGNDDGHAEWDVGAWEFIPSR